VRLFIAAVGARAEEYLSTIVRKLSMPAFRHDRFQNPGTGLAQRLLMVLAIQTFYRILEDLALEDEAADDNTQLEQHRE
jgi:hypothetical protein